jgi:hypothetical protein
MKVTQNAIRFKRIRVNHTRYRFNYADYCTAVQKAKAQDREVIIKPQLRKAKTVRILSRNVGYRRFSRRALCFLREFARLLRGVID